MHYGGPVVFLKGDMPIGYESSARGPIFGMASAASNDRSKHHTIQISGHISIAVFISPFKEMTGPESIGDNVALFKL
jgi:hypothetical protein